MITKDSFIITRSKTGYYTVRWKHNNRACKSLIHERRQANNFIRWLVKYLNKAEYVLGA